MCKIIAFAVVVALLQVVRVQVQGCKLYCRTCPYDLWETAKYYCCMQDWETQLSPKSCVYRPASSTTSTTSSTPSTSSPPSSSSTKCPPCTTSSTTTPLPNRCPAGGSPSPSDCIAYRRIHPYPTTCKDDADCTPPFNVCCDDDCFSTKICKTYKGP